MLKKNNCKYCGNNPVPHFINWYFESLNVLFTPIRQAILFNPITLGLKKLVYKLQLSLKLIYLFKALGIINFRNDREKCKVQRAKVLWEEAEKRGIEMKELMLFGRPFDVYVAERKEIPNIKFQISNKSQNLSLKFKIIFSGLPRPFNAEDRALDVMDDKGILKQKFIEKNIPVPQGGSVWNFRKAKAIFNRIQKPVIVKPRAGSRGRHSTTFVNTEKELKQAFKIAKQLCFWVVVEEQLKGPVYRATLINYELCGVLRGDSPQVVGDGISSISQLIIQKNSRAHPEVKDILVDERVELFLSRQSLNLTSIPKKGEVISLSEKIGVNYGGASSEDFDICHKDNKELFLKAAKVVGDPIVGFDFIIPDITKSYKEQKCGFIEANSLPFINLHHDPLRGKPRNVAAKVWNLVGM